MQTYGLKHMEQFLHFLRTTHIKTAKKIKICIVHSLRLNGYLNENPVSRGSTKP